MNAPDQTSQSALIVGCGYLGMTVAKNLLAAGQTVFATTRNPQREKELASLGCEPLRVDWNDPRTLQQLPETDRTLVAVAYDRRSSVDRYTSQVIGFDHLLKALSTCSDVVYISTTGVYHQSHGVWVDEASACRPPRESGRVHLQAESRLAARRGYTDPKTRKPAAWCVLRLAGIYGPGRVPRARDVIEGQPIVTRPETYLNLIHVADAASAVERVWQLGPQQRRRRYVVADGHPVQRGDFYREIARQTGSAPPIFQTPGIDTRRFDRSESNKRIWPAAMRRDLLPHLQYPDYRVGLEGLLGGHAD